MNRKFSIKDRKEFVSSVPKLIERLRMRQPAYAWSLDLTSNSLDLLDETLNETIDKLLQKQGDYIENIDIDLLQEVSAYFGQVIAQRLRGKWEINERRDIGPTVSFQIGSDKETIEPYEVVLKMFIEGEMGLSKWYKALVGS